MIRLGFRDHQTNFRPGDIIEGAALWELEKAPESAELRLLWFTRGKGTEDGAVVATERFDAPQAGDTRPFKFTAPESPYSFSGKLISLMWAVELVLEPAEDFQKMTIVIGPDAREVVLPRIEQPVKLKAHLGRTGVVSSG